MVDLSAAGLAVTCAAGAEGVSEAPSRMPSLKPLTAPPRSEPMLRSFLVPKIITTTSSTISQCQMESEPMELLLKNVSDFRRPARAVPGDGYRETTDVGRP